MRSVVFFVDSKSNSETDLRNPEEGNPGIGGTEFITILLAKMIAQNGREVEIHSMNNWKYPESVQVKLVSSLTETLNYCVHSGSVLVLRSPKTAYDQILDQINVFQNISIIFWLHLTPKLRFITRVAKMRQVKRIVCVENNQERKLTDSLAFTKLHVIPHPNVITSKQKLAKIQYNNNNICFLGALVPQKGFHILADMWPSIKKRYPDSELHVIGSSDLYSRALNPFAHQALSLEYSERVFRVLDPMDTQVHFYGNLGVTERASVIENCSIGIVNPSGETETFCLSAVELQSYGIPVVTADKNGLKDTVLNGKTGLLGRNRFVIQFHIKKLLGNPKFKKLLGEQAKRHVQEKYEPIKIVLAWEKMLREIEHNWSNDSNYRLVSNLSKSSTPILDVNRILVTITKGKWPSVLFFVELLEKYSYLNRLILRNIYAIILFLIKRGSKR